MDRIRKRVRRLDALERMQNVIECKRMKQKSCIEGISDSFNPHRDRLPFFLLRHDFVNTVHNRSVLHVRDRLEMIYCLE